MVRDYNGLQLFKYDYQTGGQEIKLAIIEELWGFSRYFVSIVYG